MGSQRASGITLNLAPFACQTRDVDAWIPLLQNLVWPLFIVVMVISLRTQLAQLGKAVTARVQGGSGLQLSVGSWFQAKLDGLQDLAHISPASPAAGSESSGFAAWTEIRDTQPKESRGLHLVHVIGPSDRGPEWFDVFVYLVGHKRAEFDLPADMADVAMAEFFLGRYWGNTIYPVENNRDGKRIGLSTSAYGPTLCVCRVHFVDGHTAVLTRYLDFEMAPRLA